MSDVNSAKTKHKFTHDQKFHMVKDALQSQEGINAILEQTGPNFVEVINRFKDGNDTDISMIMILMIVASGRRPEEKELSRKKWREYADRISPRSKS